MSSVGQKRLSAVQASAEMAVIMALTYVLSYISRTVFVPLWPEGGAISPNFLPLILYVVRNKWWYGVSCLLAYGVLSLTLPGSLLLSVWQFIFDNLLQYLPILVMMCFRRAVVHTAIFISGLLVVYMLMFGVAFVSGFLFWSRFAPAGEGKYIYALVYNLPIFLGSFVVTSLVWSLMRPQSLNLLTGAERYLRFNP